MSALDAALQQIDEVAADGDLAATPTAALPAVDPEDAGEPVSLPDGRTIYVPRLHGRRVDELACALLDLNVPARSKFLRLTGPPGTGKSQLARAIALALWRRRVTAFAFPLATALVLMVFFAFAKQAFVNYYLFVFGALVTAFVFAAEDAKADDSPP